MNGVFYECCKQWYPAPEFHRTSEHGECVLKALRQPMSERPPRSPATQLAWIAPPRVAWTTSELDELDRIWIKRMASLRLARTP